MIESLKLQSLWGNSAWEYVMALAVFVIALGVLKLIEYLVMRYLKRLAEHTETDLDDMIIRAFSRLRPPFYFALSLYIALRTLALSGRVETIINGLVFVVIVYYVAKVVGELASYGVGRVLGAKGEVSNSVIRTLSAIIRAIVWVFAVLTVLQTFGINVTSLIAGLGIGGLALAFAFQKILEDLFSSFSIYVDKPFREGDLIQVGTDIGTVKYIGLKTTRLETTNGQELIVANRELTTARVNNFKRIHKRRAEFDIGVTYETSKDKLKKIPEIARGIIEAEPGAEFNRVYLKSFGDSAIIFNVVFYSKSGEFAKYMELVDKFNYALFEAFAKEGIEFAYPTQTLYVKK